MYVIMQEVAAIPENFTGMAVRNGDGAKLWYENGKLSRLGGLPAVEFTNGDRQYFECGKLHRKSGLPAIDYVDGTKQWWIKGKLQDSLGPLDATNRQPPSTESRSRVTSRGK